MREPPAGCEGDRPAEPSCRDLLKESSPGALAPARPRPAQCPVRPSVCRHRRCSQDRRSPWSQGTGASASSGEAQGKWGTSLLSRRGAGRCEQRCHLLSRGQHGVPGLSHATSPPLATSAVGATGSEPSGEARALSPAPWSSFRCAPAWGGGPPPPQATVTAASPGFVTQTEGQRRLDRRTPPDGPGLRELRWPPGRRAGSGLRRRCWMPGWAHTGPRLVTGASSPGLCVCEGKPGAMKTRGSASPGRTAR